MTYCKIVDKDIDGLDECSECKYFAQDATYNKRLNAYDGMIYYCILNILPSEFHSRYDLYDI